MGHCWFNRFISFAGSEGIKLASTGVVSINNLSGGTTQMVVANSSGELLKQAIPSGADNLGNHIATENLQMSEIGFQMILMMKYFH